jgi:hypothetical protein
MYRYYWSNSTGNLGIFPKAESSLVCKQDTNPYASENNAKSLAYPYG